jgi:cytochrome b subunit of formate dehydrogenase
MPRPRVREVQTKHGVIRQYKRFGIWHRIEHWIFMASFSLLGLTGLLQRYAESPVSQTITEWLGGIESIRVIHRISAVVMMLMVIYHIGAVGHRMYVERKRMTMLPGMSDIRNAIQALLYNLGFRKHHAQQGRYGFEEKAEYWAVVWGTVVMGITGFMMWNPISTAKFLPGGFIPAAKTAHSLEAVLAVAAIFLWHFYNVLVKTFNRSMFIGYLTEEQMAEEHPIELADIKAGTARRPSDPEGERKRKRVFWPIFSVVIITMLVIIYWWVTFEETAIATVPPASQVEVFVPLTPTPLPTRQPTPTLADIDSATWDNGISDLFAAKCISCHNSTGKLGGLDLTSYQAALDGGDTGPAIIPGDTEASQVVVIQSAGGHPGQFSFNELDIIIQWIEAGAPEN